MTRRKPVPLVLPRSATPIYDATVRDHGFDPRAEQIDNGITHARESRKGER